jgi:curli biogenesis system outer membrane secretion channel CsgG
VPHPRLLPRAALLLALLPGLAAAAPSQESKARKPRLAILDFTATSGAYSQCSGWGASAAAMSDALHDLFTSEISERANGRLRLVERSRLQEVRAELALQQSEEVDPASARQLGKLLGAKYVLTGKITRFACKVSEAGTGWGVGSLVGKLTGSNLAGSVAGSVDVRQVSFSGRLDARLIEVETGEILVSFKDESETGSTSARVAGTGGGVQYDEELASKVFEPMVARMSSRIIKKTVVADQDDDE